MGEPSCSEQILLQQLAHFAVAGSGSSGAGGRRSWGYLLCSYTARQAGPVGKTHPAGPSPVLCSTSHQRLLISVTTLNYEHTIQSPAPSRSHAAKNLFCIQNSPKGGPTSPLSPHSRGHMPLPSPCQCPEILFSGPVLNSCCKSEAPFSHSS